MKKENEMSKKRGFIFYITIYIKIISQDFKSKMSYRADFFISTIGMILTNLSGFAAFYILFCNFDSINGWNYAEMLFLYGFSMIALTPMQCLFDNNWNLRNYVYEGDFIKYCFRPINIFFYFISEVFDVKGLGQLLMGGITLIYAWNKLSLPVHWYTVLLLLCALLSGSLFMIAIMNLAAASCFWIMNSGFIMVTMFKFTNYARYPGNIFKGVFRFIFSFVIPIAFVAYYPSLLFLRPQQIPVFTYLSPVFGILFFYLSYKVWMKGATSYTGTGN